MPGNPDHETAPRSGGDSRAHAEAIKRLFEEHNRTLVRFLQARLHNEAEARDVAQEAYVRLLELDNVDAVGFLRAYLFRIAANIAVDRIRHRAVSNSPSVQAEFGDFADEREPERVAIGIEELAVVRGVIKKLPEKCRTAFVWHVFAGRSTQAIAEDLKMTDRMIRLYIAQALAACRLELDARGSTSQRKSL